MPNDEDNEFWLKELDGVKPLKRVEIAADMVILPKKTQESSEAKKEYLSIYDFSSYSKFIDDGEFGGIDNSTLIKFKREEFKPEAVLDLHGMTENQAFPEVEDFVARCYNRGLRCIIIVTGKGLPHPNDDDIFATKGILRKSVPQWLNLPHLRAAILVYKHPSAKLGGDGALYILLRRNRKLAQK